jgi:mono/diheme cytochrome c family protein
LPGLGAIVLIYVKVDAGQFAQACNVEFRRKVCPMRCAELRCFAGVVAVIVSIAGRPADAADAARGEALARQWCVSCHSIDARVRADSPPDFASVARRPETSESSLRAWLAVPHPNMPNFELSRADAEDLVAYIRSLAQPPR